MDYRIKLAEAMQTPYHFNEGGTLYIGLPDPFTDANDDYAVLEWMRQTFNTYEHLTTNQKDTWVEFADALESHPDNGLKACYRVGDYARAAIQVIL